MLIILCLEGNLKDINYVHNINIFIDKTWKLKLHSISSHFNAQ